MKKILLSAVAVMAFGVAAQAQSEEMKFGVKAGLNLTTITGDFTDDADGATSFYVGGLVDLPIAGNFHLQPELLYSMEGADKASVSYVRIPVNAKYYIIEGLSVQAGPQIAFKVGAEDDATDEAVKSLDFGIGAGAAYELSFGLFFEAKYYVGMANISEFDGIDQKNVGIQIGAGYRF